MAKEIKPENARQGRSGLRMVFVLIAALILVFIVWAVADFYFFQIAPENTSKAQPGQSMQTKPQSALDNPANATPQQKKATPSPKAEVPNPPDSTPKNQ